MKAPDKIYLVEWDNKGISEYDTPWSPAPYGNTNCKNHKYIHKDALIEWIQEVRVIPHENSIVRDLAFQEVVNKVNSM